MRPAPRPRTHQLQPIFDRLREQSRNERDQPKNDNGRPFCKVQEAPKEQKLSRRERSRIIEECLGRSGPSHAARASLSRKLYTLDRDGDYLLEEARRIRAMKERTTDHMELHVLEDQAQQLEELAYRHSKGLRGFRGQ